MIVTLSHELNNPMTSIWGNVTYLGRCHRLGEVPEEYDEILASLERNCRRMGDLLTRLRHVQRVETTEYLPGTPMVDIQGEETRGAGDADGDES
jgi:signal transduction histidine kinase